jgi:hypothetical protein
MICRIGRFLSGSYALSVGIHLVRSADIYSFVSTQSNKKIYWQNKDTERLLMTIKQFNLILMPAMNAERSNYNPTRSVGSRYKQAISVGLSCKGPWRLANIPRVGQPGCAYQCLFERTRFGFSSRPLGRFSLSEVSRVEPPDARPTEVPSGRPAREQCGRGEVERPPPIPIMCLPFLKCIF